MNLLSKDLKYMADNVDWVELNNSRILITGASGFVGSWMVDSILYAKDKFKLDIEVCVLTRDFNKLLDMYGNKVTIYSGDVRDVSLGGFDYIIHLASHEGHRLMVDNPIEMYDIIANGAWNMLRLACKCSCKKILYMSSGVVTKEEINPYSQGKKMGEYLCNLYHEQYGLDIKIARGFDFIGGRIPLDKHFAIGNFINDILNDRPVDIKSDGLAVRSYLYMADVVVWLWTILLKGQSCVPYNVGSHKAYTIGSVARMVADFGRYNKGINCHSLSSGVNDSYYPEINNVKDLGLMQMVGLNDAIKMTLDWYKNF
jgi:nucleoside-diphosphate-sugar epimerase